jgi:hypothetical protein
MTTPDPDPIRNLGFLAWENDLAWMEQMSGSNWKKLLAKERRIWNSVAKKPEIARLSVQMLKELRALYPLQSLGSQTIGCGAIIVSLMKSGEYAWCWIWDRKCVRKASTILSNGIYCWFISESSDERYRNALVCEDREGRVMWKKDTVSSDFTIHEGRCYYINVHFPFDTHTARSCNALTGKDIKTIFKEDDQQRFIGYIKAIDQSLYIVSSTWQESKLFRIISSSGKIRQVLPHTRGQYVLDADNFFVLDINSSEYRPFGPIIESWLLPSKKYYPTWCNIRTGHLLTMADGEQTLWYCQPRKHPERIYSIIAGDFEVSPWATEEPSIRQQFIVRDPLNLPRLVIAVGRHITVSTVSQKITAPVPLTAKRLSARSADGTIVSYILVHQTNIRPTKLLGYVYGAYGSETLVSWPYAGWAPFLNRGWAIAYALVRGGGDRGIEWVEAGQRANHIKTVEDFEAVVRAAQKNLKISAQRTVIYGRSAGGLIVGATTVRNPDGHLMGATYTEVPFVDAIRSQTNPELPLTQSGWTEYGNALRSPTNFEALMRLSPMNAMPSDGVPGVFVLCRTGLLDLQVLPFESFKWITRLRGSRQPPAGKLLAFEEDETHVYGPENGAPSRAVDLAILENWAEGRLSTALKKSH